MQKEEIVKLHPEDVRPASRLIQNAVKKINSGDLTKEQLTAWARHFSEKEIPETIEKFDFFCLKKGKKLIGVVFFKESFLEGLYISPGMAGKGYGKVLLKFAEKKTKEQGYKNIILNSSKNAFNFYKKQGYLFVKDFYPKLYGVTFHEYKMEKKL